MRLLAAALLFSGAIAFAQFDQGQIAGTVTDPSNAVVANVAITAKEVRTGFTIRATTGSSGTYVLFNLPVGVYSLEIQADGFRKFVSENLIVDAGARRTVDAQLTVGSAGESVTVSASETPLSDETASVGRTIESKQISDLSLNGRNPVNLALLKAGVVGSNFNSFNPTDLSANLTINGGQQYGNNVTVDGVPLVRTRGDGTSAPAIIGVGNVDSLQEVQILTTTYPAEYGRGMDGQVRFVTKSGTRDFHGTAYEFFRNSVLDANTWLRNSSNTSDAVQPPQIRFSQPGYSIGGPVFIPGKWNHARDKLFFFVSQEWIFYHQDVSSTGVVPSLAMRTGDFSELLNPANTFFRRSVVIRDPANGNAPFANNVIPVNRLSTNGMGLLRAFPAPRVGFLNGSNNWYDSQPDPVDVRKDTVRIDYQWKNTRFSLSGNHFSYAEDAPFRGAFDVADTRWRRPNESGAFKIATTLSPTMMNEFTFTAANDVVRMTLYPIDGVDRYKRSLYGINFPYVIPGPKRVEDRIPTIDITGFTTLDGSSKPGNSSGPMYSFNDVLTHVVGSKHTLKYGFSWESAQQINADQIAYNQNGWFTFRDTGNPLTTGSAIGNVALGNDDTYFEIGPAADTHVISHAIEAFTQDQWKATSRLTIEMGVRYSYFEPWHAIWNDIANFDPNFYSASDRAVVDPKTGGIISGDPYNGIVLPGKGYPASAAGRAQGAFVPNVQRLFHDLPLGFVKSYYGNFAPRLGLAYRLNAKTVIRTGAGVFKDRPFLLNGSLFRNAPNQARVDGANGLVDSPGAGNLQLPFTLGAVANEYRAPTAYSYSFSIQRELPGHFALDVSYVGKSASDLLRSRNLNQMLPGTVQANPGINPNALRPYVGLAVINYAEQSGHSNYNGLQISLDRRFTSGLSIGLAYTWSKSIDNILTPYNAYQYVRAISSTDRPQVLSLNYIYALPFWRNNKEWYGRLFGDWQISGVISYRSGNPLSVVDSTDTAGVGTGSASQPWNIVSSTSYTGPAGVGLPWFDKSAFAVPTAGTFGNAGLNILRGPAFFSWDGALFKNFKILEQLNSQLRFEAFNFPNHPILSDPGTNPRSGNFGLISSKAGQRNLQIGFKLIF